MLAYQEHYLNNTREIRSLANFFQGPASDFESWYQDRLQAAQRIRTLRQENEALLEQCLFPVLDDLYSAPEETLSSLAAFADELLDWKTNLDCGVYVVIHDALLSLCRVRKDRDGVIRELYKLGMGLYYLRRMVEGMEDSRCRSFCFQNEMVFTEAASYMQYFEEMDREDTRGYLIRALANIALCTHDHKRRIAVSARTLSILQDAHYRALSPGLPWDAFVRKTHQQMTANRAELSRGNLDKEELAALLDSCYEVFRPEEGAANPSIRWLWPYYDMEYSCGYVDLKTTLNRLEHLIELSPLDRYDMSALYGNVQLPVYYGLLVQNNEALQLDQTRLAFLDRAYRRMLQTLLSCPAEYFDDYFYYLIDFVLTDFCEFPGCLTYREITVALMQRFSGELYIRSRQAGAMLECLCEAIVAREPGFFDDIPFLAALEDRAEKRAALLAFAQDCGLYHNFGLIKMNVQRTMQARGLFENEFQMYMLHTASGHDDLLARPSTSRLADIALGHHSWYNGAGGYPEGYARLESPYRQMTDVTAVVASLLENDKGDFDEAVQAVLDGEGKQFNPTVTAYLGDEALLDRLRSLAEDSGKEYYRDIYASGYRREA